jgi:hypothetical protein
MKLTFEQTLTEVWRQALIENASFVELGKERYSIRRTPKRGLRQVDFVFEDNESRGLEQNPETKSRWAQSEEAVSDNNDSGLSRLSASGRELKMSVS